MKVDLIKTEVGNLEIGMYVSMLDRPWLETPFKFQGFFLKTPDEIDKITKYCSHVYVDVAKETPADLVQQQGTGIRSVQTTIKKSNKTNSAIRKGFFSRFKKKKSDIRPDVRHHYKEVINLKEELPAAREHYQDANVAVRQVIQELQESNKLDFSTAKKAVKPMVESILRNRDAMAWLTLMRKQEEKIYSHSVASAVWVTILGRHLGLDRGSLEILSLGGMLHDIGKTKIPRELQSKPELLTEEEHNIVQQHVQHGVHILENTPKVHQDVISIVGTHHERHNGSGYPGGLKETSIPVYGRIVAIADVFDAMTSRSSYSERMSTYECLRTFNQLSGVDFQREMIEQFIQAIGFFPTGTLVELNNGAVGVVMKQNSAFRLRPEVMLILDEDKKLLEEFNVVNLNDDSFQPSSENSLWITRGLEPGAYDVNPEDYFLELPSS